MTQTSEDSAGAATIRVPDSTDRAEWESQYRSGRWDYLADDVEAVRYQRIAAEIRERGATSLLDLGSGTGLLYEALGGTAYPGRYLGVDWSMTALPRPPWGAGHHWVCADVTALPVRGRFDVVLLNEVLYYLDDAPAVIDGLFPLLAEGGALVVSLWQPDEGRTPRWRTFVDRLNADLVARSPARQDLLGQDGREWRLYVLEAASAPRATPNQIQ
ncbi:class I SAM-dependent methyltransferase [Micromonospora sp. SH-82]|uniref:class I SAM-dependent methyltransferase n=1 Tax=Micromonospora sp. SH-82 TaxID=3132938 RepID=UPI003EB9F4E3